MRKVKYKSQKQKQEEPKELSDLSLKELKKRRAVLPRDIKVSLIRLPNNSLGAYGMILQDFLLQRLRKLLSRNSFPPKNWLDEVYEFVGFSDNIEAFIDETRMCSSKEEAYVVRRAQLELNKKVEKVLDRSKARVEKAEKKVRSIKGCENLTRGELVLTSLVLANQGVFDSYFVSSVYDNFLSSRIFAGDMEDLRKQLVSLFKVKEVHRWLKPDAPLFVEDILELRLGDLRKKSWEEARIVPHPRLYKALGLNDDEDFERKESPYAELSPKESFKDIVLPKQEVRRIKSLIKSYKDQNSLTNKLFLLFQGKPGTGKTLLSKIVASELNRPLLRVNLGEIPSYDRPPFMRLIVAKAKKRDAVLLFEEADDFAYPNIFTGQTDSWIKVFFDDFKGVAIFTTNYQLTDPMMRRFSYILEFENPNQKDRKTIFQKEIEKVQEQQPAFAGLTTQQINELAQDHPIPGGYLQSTLELASAICDKEKPIQEALQEALTVVKETFELDSSETIKEPRTKINQVILDPKVKKGISTFIQFSKDKVIENKPQWQDIKGGAALLLSGPSGTGKTMVAEAIASELGMLFSPLSASHLLSPWVGETERNIRRAFQRAEKNKAVLFIDECESLFGSREGSARSWELSQVNELLVQMENFKGVFVAATNLSNNLDVAFSRRFVFKEILNPPKKKERQQIWSLWQEKLKLDDNEIKTLAEIEVTGGEIRNASIQYLTQGRPGLNAMKDILSEVIKGRLGLESNVGIHI